MNTHFKSKSFAYHVQQDIMVKIALVIPVINLDGFIQTKVFTALSKYTIGVIL